MKLTYSMKETLLIGFTGVAIAIIGYLSHNVVISIVSIGIILVFMGKMVKEMLTCLESHNCKEGTYNKEYHTSPK